MAALDAGPYRLRHGGASSAAPSTKRFIFVKLTDSAQTALENLKLNKDRSRGPTFQLGEKDGCIRLPNGEVFNFRVDEIPNNDGPQGSFECIQTIRRGEVEHLSDIKHRITVQATEDSFQNTREKMAKADEESKKQCAKEIKTTGPNIGQRSKVLKRPGDPSPVATSHKKPRADTVASPPGGATSKLASSSQSVIAKKACTVAPPRSSSTNNLTVPVPENSSGRSAAARSPVGSQPVRPLRERLIQTLVLKPMTKPDLIGKLKKFGYKDEERSALELLLTEVASLTKDGHVFDLLSGWYGQVDTKWSLYSPSDSMMATKRLASLENRPSGSTTLTAVQPAGSASDLPMANGTRPVPGSSTKVISHRNSDTERLQNDVARVLLAHPNPGDDLSPPPPSSSSTCSTPSPPDHSKLKEIGNHNSAHKTAPLHHNSFVSLDLDHAAGPHSERENFESTVAARYQSINTPDQRRQYKKEFFLEYSEYQDLHGQMARISGQFTDLETQLKKALNGSTEYRRIAKVMYDEYVRLNNDDEYKHKRGRWDQLSKKLTLIKQRIKAYDILHKKS